MDNLLPAAHKRSMLRTWKKCLVRWSIATLSWIILKQTYLWLQSRLPSWVWFHPTGSRPTASSTKRAGTGKRQSSTMCRGNVHPLLKVDSQFCWLRLPIAAGKVSFWCIIAFARKAFESGKQQLESATLLAINESHPFEVLADCLTNLSQLGPGLTFYGGKDTIESPTWVVPTKVCREECGYCSPP